MTCDFCGIEKDSILYSVHFKGRKSWIASEEEAKKMPSTPEIIKKKGKIIEVAQPKKVTVRIRKLSDGRHLCQKCHLLYEKKKV